MSLWFEQHRKLIVSYPSLSFISIMEGLCGEAEEVVSEIEDFDSINPQKLGKELADVVVYLFLYFDYYNIKADEIQIPDEISPEFLTMKGPSHYRLMRYCCKLAEMEKKWGRKSGTRIEFISLGRNLWIKIIELCKLLAHNHQIDLDTVIQSVIQDNDRRYTAGEFG